MYSQILRAELLGVPSGPASPEKAGPSSGAGAVSPMTSPVKKMFRYKSGDR